MPPPIGTVKKMIFMITLVMGSMTPLICSSMELCPKETSGIKLNKDNNRRFDIRMGFNEVGLYRLNAQEAIQCFDLIGGAEDKQFASLVEGRFGPWIDDEVTIGLLDAHHIDANAVPRVKFP